MGTIPPVPPQVGGFKPASPVPLVIAIAALLTSNVWNYVGIRQRQNPGVDAMSIAGTLILDLILVGVVVWCAVRLHKARESASTLPNWAYPMLGIPILTIGLLGGYIAGFLFPVPRVNATGATALSEPSQSGGITLQNLRDIVAPLQAAISDLSTKGRPASAVPTATGKVVQVQLVPENIGSFIAQWTDDLHMIRERVSGDPSAQFMVETPNARVVLSRSERSLLFQVNFQNIAPAEIAAFNSLTDPESQTMIRDLEREVARRPQISFSINPKPFAMVLDHTEPIDSSLTETVLNRQIGDMDALVLLLRQITEEAIAKHSKVK